MRTHHGLPATLASAALYNGLPQLEAASALVEKKNLIETMTNRLGPIFLRHGVHTHWGVYLLHHHWNIADHEIAGETVRGGDTAVQYEMEPVSRSAASAFVPLTIALRGGEFKALEVSSAPFALDAYEVLAKRPEFLKDLKAEIEKDGLAEHFGLVAFKPPEIGHQWTEFTPDSKRISIMRKFADGAVPATEVIDASWRFFPDGAELGPRYPGSKCGKMCSGNCYSVSGGHAAIIENA